jgi:hypothetical protein
MATAAIKLSVILSATAEMGNDKRKTTKQKISRLFDMVRVSYFVYFP